MGLDIGNESIAKFSSVIKNSSLILWNGPMGVLRCLIFQRGTVAIAEAVVEATSKGAFSLVEVETVLLLLISSILQIKLAMFLLVVEQC